MIDRSTGTCGRQAVWRGARRRLFDRRSARRAGGPGTAGEMRIKRGRRRCFKCSLLKEAVRKKIDARTRAGARAGSRFAGAGKPVSHETLKLLHLLLGVHF